MNDLPIFTASLEPAGTRDKGGFLKTGANGAPMRLLKISSPDGAQTEQWINDDQQAADNTVRRLGYKRTGEWMDGHAALAKKSFVERNQIGLALASLVVALIIIGGVSGLINANNGNSGSARETVPSDPLDQMLIAFNGSSSKTQIKEAVDNAANATGLPINDQSYSSMGSALVSWRKSYGINEVDILGCIPRVAANLGTKTGKETFNMAGALCVTNAASTK